MTSSPPESEEVPADARDLSERAVTLDRESPAMRVDLGNVRMLLGQPAEAIDAYRAATDLEPANVAGWSTLASTRLTIVPSA